MKITMYELLGMVKDGKAPKKIKYKNKLYYLQHYCNGEMDYTNEDYLDEIYHLFNEAKVNDEVEILEEEKKIPEKLDIRQEKNIKNNWKWKVYGKEHSYNISTPQKIIADKVNEICDYLKSKGE